MRATVKCIHFGVNVAEWKSFTHEKRTRVDDYIVAWQNVMMCADDVPSGKRARRERLNVFIYFNNWWRMKISTSFHLLIAFTSRQNTNRHISRTHIHLSTRHSDEGIISRYSINKWVNERTLHFTVHGRARAREIANVFSRIQFKEWWQARSSGKLVQFVNRNNVFILAQLFYHSHSHKNWSTHRCALSTVNHRKKHLHERPSNGSFRHAEPL